VSGFDDSRANEPREKFDPREHLGHLLVVRVFDEVSPVITPYCKTGYVERNGRSYPNNAVRCAVADIDELNEDGQPGKIYPQVMIFTGLLVADLKADVGRKILIMWDKKDRSDKSSPYAITEMKSNERALAAGMAFLARHPEFDELPPPPPWNFDDQKRQEQQQVENNGRSSSGGGAQNWGQHDRNDSPRNSGGSFLDQAQATNHWGQEQDDEPPF
jgi:hypothetical protein